MNLGKLRKQLTREFKANPKKSAILGLLALVGCYFWLPLLANWAKRPKAPSARELMAAMSNQSPTATTTSTLSAPSQETMAWDKLAAALDRDPHMQPAARLPLERNPFAATASPAETVEEEQEAVAHAAAQLTVDDLGLVLSSTVVGPQARLALLNGRVYREGSELLTTDGVALNLTHIAPGHVVLEGMGLTFELSLTRSDHSIEVVPLEP